MKTILALGTIIGVGALATAATIEPAHAIKCQGAVQINPTSRIVTPYCEHEEMARVARQYGVKTSGRKLRNNFNHKRRVCEFIGHDNRLSAVCGGLQRENRGGNRIITN